MTDSSSDKGKDDKKDKKGQEKEKASESYCCFPVCVNSLCYGISSYS